MEHLTPLAKKVNEASPKIGKTGLLKVSSAVARTCLTKSGYSGPGINESCWEDVDVEQGVVATRGFLIPLFLQSGRVVWVSEGYIRPLLSWPRVSRGNDVVLWFSSGVWWFDS
ncbi:hypothetical protein F2Q69_00042815 [Brassica cretica]|uniref:Uncharacterized protein n=1 Tax=Brassica cretica TaxID=69181 RepID=A0A8S9NII1_BRACR|nr:hypothetical protein F2Q69_00042815 [Brassica cretica]